VARRRLRSRRALFDKRELEPVLHDFEALYRDAGKGVGATADGER
jgi:hypothetical protein